MSLNFARMLANLEAKLSRQEAACQETKEHIQIVKAQMAMQDKDAPQPTPARERGK